MIVQKNMRKSALKEHPKVGYSRKVIGHGEHEKTVKK